MPCCAALCCAVLCCAVRLQGTRLASVLLYCAAQRETTYVSLRRHLLFQHRPVTPPLAPNVAAVASGAGAGFGRRPSTAERHAELWDELVYQRLFMSEFNAVTWCVCV
jgi:hypothetical protein